MDAVIFGLTGDQIAGTAVVSALAVLIIRQAFSAMKRREDASSKSQADLSSILATVVNRFPETLDNLSSVVDALGNTVNSLQNVLTGFITSINLKFTHLETKVSELQKAVEENNRRMDSLLKELGKEKTE